MEADEVIEKIGLRLYHSTYHRKRYDVPPAYCPLCKQHCDQLSPEEQKKLEEDLVCY